jgi:hypothetical protein
MALLLRPIGKSPEKWFGLIVNLALAEALVQVCPTPAHNIARLAEATGRRNLTTLHHLIPRRRRDPQFGGAFLAGDVCRQARGEGDVGLARSHDRRPRASFLLRIDDHERLLGVALYDQDVALVGPGIKLPKPVSADLALDPQNRVFTKCRFKVMTGLVSAADYPGADKLG